MSGRQDKGWESKIQDMVDDAIDSIDSMNFSDLNRRVQSTIDSIFDEWNIKGQRSSYRTNERRAGNYASRGPVRRTSDRRSSYATAIRRQMQNSGTGEYSYEKVEKPAPTNLYAKTPPGTFWGPIGTVVGGIMTFAFGVTAVTALGLLAGGIALGGAITGFVGAVGLAVSGAILGTGIRAKRRVGRFVRYKKTMNGRTYASVEELAGSIGKKVAFVRKDLQKMLELGFFPHGRMDQNETNLILDDETWKQYQRSKNSYQERRKTEEAQQKEKPQVFSREGVQDPEFIRAMQEGEDYIRQIREANDAIPGEDISRKLDILELLLRKIFAVLKQKPDQLPKLRKFMSFYMPTTIKLVQTYQELDAQPVEGENIRQAKREIEDTLDTINEAYKKLLDSFYEEAAMDVKTDITVLEAMLAKEGLTSSPFEVKSEETEQEGIRLTLGS